VTTPDGDFLDLDLMYMGKFSRMSQNSFNPISIVRTSNKFRLLHNRNGDLGIDLFG